MRDNCNICGRMHPAKAALPPGIRLPENSVVRDTAIKIVVMRSAGVSEEQIASSLGLAQKTLSGYVYKASRNGWLDEFLDDPKDIVEYKVVHKVIRNLNEMLDSADPLTKERVTLDVAKGTLYKKFGEQNSGQAQTTVVGVKIQIVPGAATEVREGTVQGANNFIDADLDES